MPTGNGNSAKPVYRRLALLKQVTLNYVLGNYRAVTDNHVPPIEKNDGCPPSRRLIEEIIVAST